MTHSELFKLYELKGRLQGRTTCLKNDISGVKLLIPALVSESYKNHFEGRLTILEHWQKETDRLLDEVERIIREAENDRE